MTTSRASFRSIGYFALATAVACGSLNQGEIVITDDGAGGSGANQSGTSNGGEDTSAGEGGSAGAGTSGGAGEGSTVGGAGAASDAPTVVSVSPDDEELDVETDATSVTLEFSEPLDPATVTTDSVRLLDGDTELEGAVEVSGATVTFTPSAPLQLLARYQVEVTTSVTDAGGEALAETFTSTFATRDGVWGDKLDLDPDSDDTLSGITLASNARGDVLVGYVRPVAGDNTSAFVRWYRRGTGWDAPKALNLAGTRTYEIALAVNDVGDAAVVFGERDAGSMPADKVFLQRFTAGVWQARKQLVNVGLNASLTGVQVTLTPGGLAVLGAQSSSTLFTGYSLPNGTTNLVDVTSYVNINSPLALASNAEGRSVAVYRTSTTGMPNVVRFSRFNPDDHAWSDANAQLPSSVGGSPPDVAMSDVGEAMAIWTRTPTGDVVASYFKPASGWSEPVVIDALPGTCTITEHSIASDGRSFMAVWSQEATDSLTNAYSSRFDLTTKTWSDPVLVSDGNSSVGPLSVSLSMDRRGNALATWSQGQFTAYRGWYNRYSALGGEWLGAGNAPDAENVFAYVGSSVAADGLAFGVWTKGVTSGFEFWAAPFE